MLKKFVWLEYALLSLFYNFPSKFRSYLVDKNCQNTFLRIFRPSWISLTDPLVFSGLSQNCPEPIKCRFLRNYLTDLSQILNLSSQHMRWPTYKFSAQSVHVRARNSPKGVQVRLWLLCAGIDLKIQWSTAILKKSSENGRIL